MKKFTRIISLFLCLLLTFSVGCKKNKGDGSSTTQNAQNPNKIVYTSGVHNFEVSETSNFVVYDGKTDYKIVIPEGADDLIIVGAEELQLFFEEATGIKLEIIDDTTITYSANSKYFILGSKKLMSAAGVATDYSVLNRNGYIIKTVGTNVFICGAHNEGTLFGVYGLLEQMFEYDCFSNTAYYILRGLKEVKLMNYNITNAPDIELRNSGFGTVRSNGKTVYRMGYTLRNESLFSLAASSHTLWTILPPDKYNVEKIMDGDVEVDNPDYHPKWYSLDQQQWCFTARGDDAELELMYQTVFEVAKQSYIDNPKGSIFTIGVEDKNVNCMCSECSIYLAEYKTPSAVYIQFCNEIAERIKTWMESEEGKPYAREFLVKLIAYQKHEPAPAKLNTSTGEYEPINGLVCHDNVTVEFSPAAIDFQVSVFDEQNKIYMDSMKQWQAVCKNISGYAHCVNFFYLFVPYDVFNSKQDHYHWLADANTIWFYDEGDAKNSSAMTGWNTLKVYLISELGWDVNIDWAATIDKFFDQYFQEAAEPMRKFFDSYRVHSKNMIDNGGMNVSYSINFTSLDAKFWPSGMLELWAQYIDEAIESISDIKYYDIEKYNELYDRIALERISVYYMMVQLYPERYSDEELLRMKLMVKEDCDRLRLYSATGATLTDLWTKWGI